MDIKSSKSSSIWWRWEIHSENWMQMGEVGKNMFEKFEFYKFYKNYRHFKYSNTSMTVEIFVLISIFLEALHINLLLVFVIIILSSTLKVFVYMILFLFHSHGLNFLHQLSPALLLPFLQSYLRDTWKHCSTLRQKFALYKGKWLASADGLIETCVVVNSLRETGVKSCDESWEVIVSLRTR